MITTSIVFDHRGRTPRTSAGPLEVRVTIDRRSYYIGTGVRVRRAQWSFDRVINHPEADVLNERLSIVLRKVLDEINQCLARGREVDVAAIRRIVWGHTESSREFLEWTREQVAALDVAPGTRKHYDTLCKRLEQWEGMKDWRSVNVENVYAFDAWLHSLRRSASNIEEALGTTPPLLSDAAVHNYHKCLRYLLSRAERMGLIMSNPYNALRGEFAKGEKENTEYLTEEEMKAFESIHPVAGTEMALSRDLFVFQMYTGLSYSDAQAFDISQYKKIDGKWRRTGERIKTGVPFVNMLLPPAVEVLERYGMKIPKISNENYNRNLKALGMCAGISIPLHSHLARHTFATFMLRNGVKIENLAKMLGHADISRTQRYAKVLAESVHEDFAMIEEKLKGKKRD